MSASLRLYDATAQLDVVRDWLVESGGELTPEIEALLTEAQEAFDTKVERVALFIRELLATAAAVKVERERLAALEKSYSNGAESLKHYLQRQMKAAGVQRVEGTLAKVRLQKSPPSVKSTLDVDALRAAFEAGADWVTMQPATYRLYSAMIVDHAKHGISLPEGVTVEQGQHVRIS